MAYADVKLLPGPEVKEVTAKDTTAEQDDEDWEVDEQQADVCSSGYDMLSQVNVDSNGAFDFSCWRSPRLCKCISAIGTGKVGDQVFFADSLELTVFRADDGDNKGYAAYEIKEGDEYIVYGDVNDGRMDRRRRRLLQAGVNGGS